MESIVIPAIGAFCFGLVVGWVTYRSLRRKQDQTTLSDISAVIAAVGGAAVTALFQSGTLFGMYCIGLAVGFFLYFGIAYFNTKKNPNAQPIDAWMGRDPE